MKIESLEIKEILNQQATISLALLKLYERSLLEEVPEPEPKPLKKPKIHGYFGKLLVNAERDVDDKIWADGMTKSFMKYGKKVNYPSYKEIMASLDIDMDTNEMTWAKGTFNAGRPAKAIYCGIPTIQFNKKKYPYWEILVFRKIGRIPSSITFKNRNICDLHPDNISTAGE